MYYFELLLWVQLPMESILFSNWNFLKPFDVNSGLKCKFDLIVKTTNATEQVPPHSDQKIK